MVRKNSRTIKIGKVAVGGGNPVVVQSMTNTDTRDVKATVNQIRTLERAGCELVRLAVVDESAAAAIGKIKPNINIPLVADIHFDYRLALKSLQAGAEGLRINPGNIGSRRKVEEVAAACRDLQVPIRIGVNAGSLDKRLLNKYGRTCAEAMVDSALENIHVLEDLNFTDIKLSLKSSSVLMTIEAYRSISRQIDYPLHLGITEAGTTERALIKSAFGIGLLLYEGIGDTIRVSLTSDPVDEVWAAYEILRMLGLRDRGVELISCPSCGRCEIDLIAAARQVDQLVRTIPENLKVAVMGCVVNGPGEAREADVGIAGGRGQGLLFRRGQIIKKVPEDQLVDALKNEINEILKERDQFNTEGH